MDVSDRLCSVAISTDNTSSHGDVQRGGTDDILGSFSDPFDYVYGDYNPWCGIDAYRYWHSHTEYATLRGLQHFGSAAELLTKLSELLVGPESEGRSHEIVLEMRAH